MGLPERRVVGDLRAGLGKPEPAGVRGDLRSSRRTVRRPVQLERGLHAGGVSGAPIFRSSGDPIIDLKPPAEVTPGAAARPARSAGQAERAGPEEVSGQLRTGGAHLFVRAGVPDAGLRAGSGGRESRVGGHAQTLRAGRQGHRAVRPAVPDGAAPGGARRPVRAALSRRARPAESGHLGCARRCEGEPHAARRRSGSADRRPADRSEGARSAGYHAGASGTASSGACRFRRRASAAITIPAR